MARRQLVFCFETNNRAGTDYVYVKDTLERFYELDKLEPIKPIYMGGKQKYNSKDIEKKIKSLTKDYPGKIKIFYCIDTDHIDTNPVQVKEFKNISDYCNAHGYEMIWFCRDIEEVYLGSSVPDKEKVSKAKTFRTGKGIDKVSKNRLDGKEPHAGTSNILRVLDKYLTRKDK